MIQSGSARKGFRLDLAYIPIPHQSCLQDQRIVQGERERAVAVHEGHRAGQRLHTDWFVDERSDREGHRRGREHSPSLSEMFDGDWELVLAAYNSLAPGA